MTISSAAPGMAVEQALLPPVRDLGGGFKVRRALPSAQRRMVGPFIFLDHFGPIVFRVGAGPNIRPHPHIGLSTLSYLLDRRHGRFPEIAGETEFIPLPP